MSAPVVVVGDLPREVTAQGALWSDGLVVVVVSPRLDRAEADAAVSRMAEWLEAGR